jgi:hypothetical protein
MLLLGSNLCLGSMLLLGSSLCLGSMLLLGSSLCLGSMLLLGSSLCLGSMLQFGLIHWIPNLCYEHKMGRTFLLELPLSFPFKKIVKILS